MAEASVDLPTILLLTFLVLLIALVTISYEVAVRQLHRLFRRYRLPPVFLAKMFEELAKLGLISFVLAILGSLELFEQNTEDLIANVHLILFAMGVAYVMLVAAILAGSVLWTRRYSILELRCADSSPGFLEGEEPASSSWSTAFSVASVMNVPVYARIRGNCIAMHRLPPDFPFDKYLKGCTQHTILATIGIDFKLWMSIVVCVFVGGAIDLVVSKIASLLSVLVTLLLLELGLFGLSIVLAAKARKMVREVANLPVPEDAVLPIEDDACDRHVHRSFLEQQRKTFCPCTVPVDTPTSSLFWLRSKGLYRGLIQMIILYQALTLAVLARSVIAVFSDAIYLTLIIAGVVVVLLACIVFLAIPYLIPLFSLVAFSREFADRTLMRALIAAHYSTDEMVAYDSDDESEVELALMRKTKAPSASDDLDGHLSLYLPHEQQQQQLQAPLLTPTKRR